MTDAFIDAPAERAESRSQIAAAIILGIAAVLTAFSAYQAALKDGEALQGYTTSSRTLTDANGFYSDAAQIYALDQQLFVEYATAAQAGNVELSDYLLELMRPELQEAVQWWTGTDDAITPFDEMDGNPYTVAEGTEAEALEEQAAQEFDTATDDDNQGDRFELAAVLFALTLFFGGVATLFGRLQVTMALLGVATVTLVGGAIILGAAL